MMVLVIVFCLATIYDQGLVVVGFMAFFLLYLTLNTAIFLVVLRVEFLDCYGAELCVVLVLFGLPFAAIIRLY